MASSGEMHLVVMLVPGSRERAEQAARVAEFATNQWNLAQTQGAPTEGEPPRTGPPYVLRSYVQTLELQLTPAEKVATANVGSLTEHHWSTGTDHVPLSSDDPPVGINAGHGHVWKRPDGMVARCGGPALCSECDRDRVKLTRGTQVEAVAMAPNWLCGSCRASQARCDQLGSFRYCCPVCQTTDGRSHGR